MFNSINQASGGVGKKTRRADKNSVADLPGSNKSSSVKSPMIVKFMIPKLAPVKLKEIELSLSHSKRAFTVKLLKLDQAAWGAKIFNALVPKCEVSLTEHLFKGDGNLLNASLIEGSSSLAKLLAMESDKCGHKCSRTPFNANVSSVKGLERTALTNWSRNLWRKAAVDFLCGFKTKTSAGHVVCRLQKYMHKAQGHLYKDYHITTCVSHACVRNCSHTELLTLCNRLPSEKSVTWTNGNNLLKQRRFSR